MPGLEACMNDGMHPFICTHPLRKDLYPSLHKFGLGYVAVTVCVHILEKCPNFVQCDFSTPVSVQFVEYFCRVRLRKTVDFSELAIELSLVDFSVSVFDKFLKNDDEFVF